MVAWTNEQVGRLSITVRDTMNARHRAKDSRPVTVTVEGSPLPICGMSYGYDGLTVRVDVKRNGAREIVAACIDQLDEIAAQVGFSD